MERQNPAACGCGRPANGTQLCMVLYDVKKEPSEKETTLPLGAIEAACCETCLARRAWKNIGMTFLWFFIQMIAVFVIAWLVGKVFRLAWIGGGMIVIGLTVGLIRDLSRAVKNEATNGAAHRAKSLFQRRGTILAEDFIWLSEAGRSLLAGQKLDLRKTAFVTAAAIEESLKKAPADDDEAQAVRLALNEASSHASECVRTEPPKIGKAFYFPIMAIVLAASVLFADAIILSASTKTVDVVMIALSIIGVVLLLWKKTALGYLPLTASGVMVSVRSSEIFYARSSEVPVVVLMFLLIIPILCFLPYLGKKEK